MIANPLNTNLFSFSTLCLYDQQIPLHRPSLPTLTRTLKNPPDQLLRRHVQQLAHRRRLVEVLKHRQQLHTRLLAADVGGRHTAARRLVAQRRHLARVQHVVWPQVLRWQVVWRQVVWRRVVSRRVMWSVLCHPRGRSGRCEIYMGGCGREGVTRLRGILAKFPFACFWTG
eukprot:364197-Chlamydomonas_euryale.AAC.15